MNIKEIIENLRNDAYPALLVKALFFNYNRKPLTHKQINECIEEIERIYPLDVYNRRLFIISATKNNHRGYKTSQKER